MLASHLSVSTQVLTRPHGYVSEVCVCVLSEVSVYVRSCGCVSPLPLRPGADASPWLHGRGHEARPAGRVAPGAQGQGILYDVRLGRQLQVSQSQAAQTNQSGTARYKPTGGLGVN